MNHFFLIYRYLVIVHLLGSLAFRFQRVVVRASRNELIGESRFDFHLILFTALVSFSIVNNASTYTFNHTHALSHDHTLSHDETVGKSVSYRVTDLLFF